MKQKIYVIVFLLSILFTQSLIAQVDNRIISKINVLNKKINDIDIDTFNLRLEYQDIFDNLKSLKIEEQVPLHLLLIKNVSNIKLKSLSHLFRRMSLEKNFIKNIKIIISSNKITNELQTNFVLGIEKYILLNKDALIRATRNDSQYLVDMAKNDKKGKGYTEEQLNILNNLYDYAHDIVKKDINKVIIAIQTDSFKTLNNLLLKKEEYESDYILNKNNKVINDRFDYRVKELAYILMPRNLQNIYNMYMKQIESNQKFLEYYN